VTSLVISPARISDEKADGDRYHVPDSIRIPRSCNRYAVPLSPLVHWYIGGTQVCGTGTALASITAVSGQFAWTAVALSATSVTMSVDYVDWQRQVVR
jgi:hypothetical protein